MAKKKPTARTAHQTKTLDLHGYQSDDVLEALDRFIYDAGQKNISPVKVMTGKGKGVVKSIVLTYLKQGGYPWEYEKLSNGSRNEGVLVVFT